MFLRKKYDKLCNYIYHETSSKDHFQSVSSHYLSFHSDYEMFKFNINSPSPKIRSYSDNSSLYLVFSIIFQNIALCIFKNTCFRFVNALQEDLIFDMVTSSYICYLLSSRQIIVISVPTSPSHRQTLLLISINPRRVCFFFFFDKNCKMVVWFLLLLLFVCLFLPFFLFHRHIFQMLLIHFPQKWDSWIILSPCISLHFQI